MIGIRVDVNDIVATGHFMRCATVADTLISMGEKVIFISADDEITAFAKERGFEYHVLHTMWNNLDGEIDTFLEFLRSYNDAAQTDGKETIDKLLIDSYQVTEAYLSKLKNAGYKTTYFDDLNELHYPADLLINYGPGATMMGYPEKYANDNTKLLLGIKYVPLREQFQAAGRIAGRAQNKSCETNRDFNQRNNNHDDIRYIFLTTGGADKLGISNVIIQKLLMSEMLAHHKLVIHVLAGRLYQIPEELERYISDDENKIPRVIIHQNVTNVAEIMSMCDAGVTPAGTTLFELTACGVPSVSFVFADNQEADGISFDKMGLIRFAGDYRSDRDKCLNIIEEEIGRLLVMDAKDREALAGKLRGAIDGNGAEYIAGEIIKL